MDSVNLRPSERIAQQVFEGVNRGSKLVPHDHSGRQQAFDFEDQMRIADQRLGTIRDSLTDEEDAALEAFIKNQPAEVARQIVKALAG